MAPDLAPTPRTAAAPEPGAAPPPQAAPSGTPRRRTQFGLLSFVLFVLWAASGTMAWLDREPWARIAVFQLASDDVNFSPDSSFALLNLETDGMQLVRARDGLVLGRSAVDLTWSSNFRLSDDGNWIACKFMEIEKTPEHLELLDFHTGKAAHRFELVRIGDYHFSKDGQHLVVQHGWGIDVCRLDNGETLRRLPVLYAEEPEEVATTGTEDEPPPPAPRPPEEVQKVRACEQAMREARSMDTLQAAIDGLDALPHASSMTAGMAGTADRAFTELDTPEGRFAYGWDLATGARVSELEGYGKGVQEHPYTCLSADGRFVAAFDHVGGSVRVWDWATGRLRAETRVEGAPLDEGYLEFVGGGRMLHVYGLERPFLWEFDRDRRVPMRAEGLMLLLPDARTAVCMEAKTLVWKDTASGETLLERPAPPFGCSVSLVLSADGQHLSATGRSVFAGGESHLYVRRHGEGPYGLFEMPVTWAFIALTLVQLARFVRWWRRRKAAAISAQA